MNNDTTCKPVQCDQGIAERPRYYARQLITSDDLTLEQDYFRSKLRLHNRLLHGWGVVCGAEVRSVPKANSDGNTEKEPWMVMVCPGYVLGPYGDEIYIDCKRKVDLRTRGVVGVTGEPCADEIDPWCSEVHEERETPRLYVAVRYKQFATRPVRVQPVGCGCDDSRCENSRWRDGYEIGILTAWPYCGDMPPASADIWTGKLAECKSCPKEPWVVLAQVDVDANGAVTIDNCACRRLVVSFSNFWLTCTEAGDTDGDMKADGLPPPTKAAVSPPARSAKPTEIRPAARDASPASATKPVASTPPAEAEATREMSKAAEVESKAPPVRRSARKPPDDK